ncbi:MAG: choice-of-anchor D domain-containing protein [Deltaproteobacteria bacterium]
MLRRLAPLLVLVTGCDCGAGTFANVYPDIRVHPEMIDFGEVRIGEDARIVTVGVANAGTATLHVAAVQRAEGTSDVLTFDTAGFDVAIDAQHDREVTLTPLEVGVVTGALIIVSDDADQPEVTVPIQGTILPAAGPRLSMCVEAEGLDRTCGADLIAELGEVLLGTSREAKVTFVSEGTEPLTVAAALAGSSHASYSASELVTTLAPSETATLAVTFAPVDTGLERAQLVVETNDPNAVFTQIRFRGTGVETGLCANAESLDFGSVEIGDYAERQLTIENCGAAPITLAALDVLDADVFTIERSDALPLRLEVGATTEVTVRYAPTDGQPDSGRLRITSEGPSVFVTLEGRPDACTLVALPSQIDFGTTNVATAEGRTLVLANTGTRVCEILAFTFSSTTSTEFSASFLPEVPRAVDPGGTETVELRYAPVDLGVDNGALIVTTNAGDVVVDILGDSRNASGCTLLATPNTLNFGAVAHGSSSLMGFSVLNVGVDFCRIVTVTMDAGSSPDFALEGLMIPRGLNPQEQTSVMVRYTPTVSSATGTVLIAGPAGTQRVQVTGTGTGARLCVQPNPIVFGTRPSSSVTSRAVDLTACGSQDVVVSALSLPAPTTPELSIYMPPTMPFTITAGQSRPIELRYAGTNEGRDDGLLQVDSNDAIAPSQQLDIIAHTSAAPCGDIQGRICDLSQSGPVVGALVYVDTPGGRIQTTTNANGDYVLTCVPVGGHTVHAEKGQWSVSSSAVVDAYVTTVLPGQQCLEPTSANVAVIHGAYDNIENILATNGVPYDFYMDAATLVGNPTLLGTYDILFINCGWDETIGLTPPHRANIEAFVDGGGSLYTSDYAYDVIEMIWPDAIDFYGDDTVQNAAQAATFFRGYVGIVHPGLSIALNHPSQIYIDASYVGTVSAGPGTTVYLEGPRPGVGPASPFMVSFTPSPTSGRVFSTDFHNNGVGAIAAVFDWLLLNL